MHDEERMQGVLSGYAPTLKISPGQLCRPPRAGQTLHVPRGDRGLLLSWLSG